MPDPTENRAIVYRPFTSDDIPAAHALSIAVKWRHRIDDWRFAARSGHGFVAEDASGVIGTVLVWKFDRETGALGMVIVAPDHQGRGIGRKLLELALAELGPRIAQIHATSAAQPLCVKLGFEKRVTIRQHQGAAFQPPLVSLPPGERLRPIGANDMPRLVELASRASGVDRSVLLPQVLDVANGIALDCDGELTGFALFRRFGDGHVIGPVVAPRSGATSRARALISYWLAQNAGMFVRIDTPDDSGLSEWLEGLGLPLVDSVDWMVLGGALPDDPQFRQFAITNQSVG